MNQIDYTNAQDSSLRELCINGTKKGKMLAMKELSERWWKRPYTKKTTDKEILLHFTGYGYRRPA